MRIESRGGDGGIGEFHLGNASQIGGDPGDLSIERDKNEILFKKSDGLKKLLGG